MHTKVQKEIEEIYVPKLKSIGNYSLKRLFCATGHVLGAGREKSSKQAQNKHYYWK